MPPRELSLVAAHRSSAGRGWLDAIFRKVEHVEFLVGSVIVGWLELRDHQAKSGIQNVIELRDFEIVISDSLRKGELPLGAPGWSTPFACLSGLPWGRCRFSDGEGRSGVSNLHPLQASSALPPFRCGR